MSASAAVNLGPILQGIKDCTNSVLLCLQMLCSRLPRYTLMSFDTGNSLSVHIRARFVRVAAVQSKLQGVGVLAEIITKSGDS